MPTAPTRPYVLLGSRAWQELAGRLKPSSVHAAQYQQYSRMEEKRRKLTCLLSKQHWSSTDGWNTCNWDGLRCSYKSCSPIGKALNFSSWNTIMLEMWCWLERLAEESVNKAASQYTADWLKSSTFIPLCGASISSYCEAVGCEFNWVWTVQEDLGPRHTVTSASQRTKP